MIALLLATGCAKHAPPALFPVPLPEPSPPAAVQAPVRDDACLDAMPYLTGKSPPFVVDGLVACRAQVVPEQQVVQLVNDADAGLFWEPVAKACYDRSAADRILAQSTVNTLWHEKEEAKADARAGRWIGPALFVGGAALGLAAGAATASATR